MYAELQTFTVAQKAHGPEFLIGDFNARMYFAKEGEGDIVGHI